MTSTGQRPAADTRRPRCPTMAQPQRRPRAVQVSVGGGRTSGSTGSVSTLRRSGAGMADGPRDLLVMFRFGNAGRRLGLTWLSGERATTESQSYVLSESSLIPAARCAQIPGLARAAAGAPGTNDRAPDGCARSGDSNPKRAAHQSHAHRREQYRRPGRQLRRARCCRIGRVSQVRCRGRSPHGGCR
jgi:hypothetical protein